jgi:hypothetical protein
MSVNYIVYNSLFPWQASDGIIRESETPGGPTLFGRLFRVLGPRCAPDPGGCRGPDGFGRNTREIPRRRPVSH